MQTPRDIQSQLRSLSISTEQRPTPQRAGRSRAGWAIAFVLLIAAGVLGFVFRDRLAPMVRNMAAAVEKPASVELVTVSQTLPPEPAAALTATGKIVSDHTVSVATKVSGQVVALYFEQGDRVSQGQLLARIEDVLYRARRDETAARVERSKANLAFQRFNHERVQRLLASESAPSIEFADARRALDEAEAQLSADLAVLEFAQKTLNDCEVTAPIAGVILERAVEVGDFVAAEGGLGANANARFANIADMSKLRVEVDISELDIARLRKDMPCTIVPDAYKDRRYTGHVLWIDPGANYSKATVQVKVRVNDPDEFLRVEGSAQVVFLTEAMESVVASGPPAIWIPSSAVETRPDGSTTVLAAVNGRLQSRDVTVGRRQGDRVEITAGLVSGESIAAGNLEKLADGQRIGS